MTVFSGKPLALFCHSFVLLSVGTLPLVAHAQAGSAWDDPSLPAAQRAHDLVGRMTLEEKIGQMMDQSPAIPRLGIPKYGWWNEGLHGIARSGYATMFPQAIGMAATWDTEMLGRMGETVSTEARAKYNRAIEQGNHDRYFGLTIWSPNINIFRDPRWGRGQETYGEDPYLTSRLGVAFVEGLQGTDPNYYRTIATPKHFAVHSGPESERHRFDVTPSPHDLEDTYLPAFRATITEGHADSIMCAYNRVDGTPACANTMLLQQTLRRDWGFQGFVTTDCGAVYDFYMFHKTSPDDVHASALAVAAGADTDCGTEYKALGQAVKDKLIPESAINAAVERLFTARIQLGMFGGPAADPYASIPFSQDDSAAHRALAVKAAEEAMVLLKNEQLKSGRPALPLDPGLGTIAVIGPNAASLAAIEGNYNAIPSHPELPLDGIQKGFSAAKVLYAQGSAYVDGLPLPAPRTLFHPSAEAMGEAGLKAEYFAAADLSGQPVTTRIDPQIDFDWAHASPVSGLSEDSYSVRWSGVITPPMSGDLAFAVKLERCDCGDRERVAVTLDGQPVPVALESAGSRLSDFTLKFADTRPHALTIEYRHDSKELTGGITLEWKPPAAPAREAAVEAARQADVVLAFVGLSPLLEGEEMPVHVEGFAGGDRTDIALPAAQEQLLEAVAATGKPLVVVLMNGSALAVDWAQQHAAAILEAWYPGESAGTAIAETLSGKSNPGGKLPVTFYRSVGDLPAFEDYSMKGRTYRYFNGKPLYGFGYGLSYTRFAFGAIRLSAGNLQAGQSVEVEAEVRNTGSVAGDEVAELYLAPPKTDVSPRLALSGFARVHLAPGESKQVHFHLSPRDLSVVDAQGKRAMTAGSYTLYLGGGQPGEAPGVSAQFVIEGRQELPR